MYSGNKRLGTASLTAMSALGTARRPTPVDLLPRSTETKTKDVTVDKEKE